MWSTPFNPFTWDESSQRVTTHVASLDVRNGREKLIPMSGLSPGVTILLPLNRQTSHHPANNSLGTPGMLRHHNIHVQQGESMVEISIVPQANHATISYLKVLLPGEISPPFECKRVRGKWRKRGRITCNGNNNVSISFTAFTPGNYILDIEFGVKQNDKKQEKGEGKEDQDEEKCIEIKEPPSRFINENVTYTYTVSESTCLFWESDEFNWKTAGCKVRSSSYLRACRL